MSFKLVWCIRTKNELEFVIKSQKHIKIAEIFRYYKIKNFMFRDSEIMELNFHLVQMIFLLIRLIPFLFCFFPFHLRHDNFTEIDFFFCSIWFFFVEILINFSLNCTPKTISNALNGSNVVTLFQFYFLCF